MNSISDEKKINAAAWPVRPLTRTKREDGSLYRREKDVERQIQALAAETERSRRATLTEALTQERSWDDALRLREETIVYFLREYARRGDDDVAWLLAELIVDRIAGHVQRKMGRWRLSPDVKEDCERDLIAGLYDALFDRDSSAEFWEVRFWVCLDRRLWNLLEKHQAILDNERSPSGEAILDGGGGAESASAAGDAEERLFARITDRSSAGLAEQIERMDALSLLTATERTAVYLVYVEGLPEESDDPNRASAARILGVTGRSVRNYLRRAREKLVRYFA